MKFTDEQKELLALLPQELKNSQELTDSARLVLSNIIFLYGMEDAQKNGYVYRSYDDLMKDTLIKSKTSISKAIALLVQKGYVKVKSGRLKDRKANEFTLLDDTLLNKKCTEKCTDKCTVTDYCSNEIKTLQNQVLLLQKQVVLLQKEIEELKKCTDKCTDKNEKCTDKCTEKCTTDPEPESETKINNNKNNNITTGILEHKDLEPEVTEDKKENKKEKVNEMKNAVLNEMERKDNEIITSTSGEKNTNFNVKEPVYGNLTDDLFEEIFGNEENEMSDNGTSVMNAKSEMKCNVQQRKSIALGCDKINEMTTSTQGNIITSNSGNGEHKVQSGKVISNCSIFTENCPKTLPNPNPFPSLNEIWKPVVGYEDLYEISNKGNIKRLARWFKTKGQSEQWRKELILTPTLNEKGYQRVELFDIDGNRKKHRVHRLVADAFIPNPNNYPQVNHKDENKQNNCVDNLEWCTNQYNTTYSLGKPVIQYTADGTIVNTYNSISQAVRETGYSEKTITMSCKGYETPYDHKWEYKATGDVETPSMEQLPTDELKTRQNAQECPQIEFDEKWYNETYALMNNLNTLEDLDKLYNRLKQNKNKRLIIDFNRIVWDSKSKVKENLKNRLAQMSADLERMTA